MFSVMLIGRWFTFDCISGVPLRLEFADPLKLTGEEKLVLISVFSLDLCPLPMHLADRPFPLPDVYELFLLLCKGGDASGDGIVP